MNRFSILASILLLLVLTAGGCADSSDNAPDVDEAHPQDWIFVHGDKAQEDLSRCRSCHGSDFQGREEAVSCFACHFSGPPAVGNFTVHPPEWGENVIAAHQTFPQNYSWTTCANFACHGEDLFGGSIGPTCFNQSAFCHAATGGDPPAPHVSGFSNPQLHGPVARDEQFFCRNCHGRPPFHFDGGFVADPAILDLTVGNCSLSFCHPSAMAHPTNWRGDNDPDPIFYFASHQNVDQTRVPSVVRQSCALCHRIDALGTGPLETAPSCIECHPEGTPGL